jgi:hypothetical protein
MTTSGRLTHDGDDHHHLRPNSGPLGPLSIPLLGCQGRLAVNVGPPDHHHGSGITLLEQQFYFFSYFLFKY